MSSVTAFCASLIANRYVPRKEKLASEILLDEIQLTEAERYLSQCGLRLVNTPFSDYLGVALLQRDEDGASIADAVFGDDDPRPFVTFSIRRDELGLAMLLWMLLCLPKRQPEEVIAIDSATTNRPRILISQLITDFPLLGHPKRIRMNLTKLRHLGVVTWGVDEYVVEGPLLEILFDGSAISAKIADPAFRDTVRKLSATRAAQKADLMGQAEASEARERTPAKGEEDVLDT
jgi:hypothetical protein